MSPRQFRVESCTQLESKVIFHGPQAYISPELVSRQTRNRESRADLELHRCACSRHCAGNRRSCRVAQERHGSNGDAGTESLAKLASLGCAGDYIDGMLRNIVEIEIPIRELTGKWKISQHRPREESARVVGALHELADTDSHAIANAMSAVIEPSQS